MRESGIGNLQFSLDVPDDQSLRMRRQEQLHDPQPRLRAHRREHICILRHRLRPLLVGSTFHISIFAEIWLDVNVPFFGPPLDEVWFWLKEISKAHSRLSLERFLFL